MTTQDSFESVSGASNPLESRADLSRLLPSSGDAPILLPPQVGYSRYDDSDPLANENRRQIYAHVQRAPGASLSDVAAETGIPMSTVRYHIRILVHERLLQTELTLGQRRLFERPLENGALRAILNDVTAGSIIRTVDHLEPVKVTGVASNVDRSPSTISYDLSRLGAEGSVDKEWDGQRS